MKAYGFSRHGGPEVQEHLDLAVPTPMGGEIRIAVRAAGVNPADHKIRSGAMGDALREGLPVPMGREAAGVVTAVGPDVTGFAVGDEVFGTVAPASGAFAEEALLTARATAHKPAALSWHHAAVLPVAAATAWDGLAQLDLRAGQTLLVNGVGGGVGLVAAQLGRDRGIPVFGTAREDKRAVVEAQGVTLVPSGDGVVDAVKAMLPDGVHAVLDLVGGAPLGQLTALVRSPEAIVTAVDPQTAERIGARWIARSSEPAAVLDALAALVVEGKVDPHVVEVRPLAEAEAAVAAVETGRPHGKVVVEVTSG